MEPVTLFEERELKVGFDVAEYRLIPGCIGELGEPIEQFLHLYGVSPQDMVRIATPVDLSRITRAVRSESEALEFVQLFTAPQTHYLFDQPRVLIDLTIADTEPRGFGVIDRGLAQRLALRVPQVAAENGAFHIDRCLVGADPRGDVRSVLVRSERVHRDGRYEIVSERVVATVGPEEVALPSYE